MKLKLESFNGVPTDENATSNELKLVSFNEGFQQPQVQQEEKIEIPQDKGILARGFDALKNSALGGAKQYVAEQGTSIASAYAKGQNARNTMMQGYANDSAYAYERAEKDLQMMLEDNAKVPSTWSDADVESQKRMVADLKIKNDALNNPNIKNIQQGAVNESINSMGEVSQSANKNIETAKANLGNKWLGDRVVDALASTTQVTLDALTNKALGVKLSPEQVGVKVAEKGAKLTAKDLLGNFVKRTASNAMTMGSFASRAYGGAIQNAMNQGATLEDAQDYAVAVATIEIATEMISNIPSLQKSAYGEGMLDDRMTEIFTNLTTKLTKTEVGKKVATKVAKVIANGFGEGMEEVIADWLEWQLPRMYGGDVDKATDVLIGNLDSFVTGAISGLVGDSVGNVANTINTTTQDYAIGSQIKQRGTAQELVDQANVLESGISKEKAQGKTGENISKLRLGMIARNLQTDTAKQSVSNVAKEQGIEDENVIEALKKLAVGEELTTKDKELLDIQDKTDKTSDSIIEKATENYNKIAKEQNEKYKSTLNKIAKEEVEKVNSSENGLFKNEASKRLKSREARLMDLVAKKLNKKIIYSDNIEIGDNGKYDENGNIWISSKSQNPLGVVFAHEVAHDLKVKQPELFNELQKQVESAEGNQKQTILEVLNKSYNSDIAEENVAHFVENLQVDISEFEKLVGINRNLATKIYDFVKDIFNNSSVGWNKGLGEGGVSKELYSLVEDKAQVKDTFLKAMEKALGKETETKDSKETKESKKLSPIENKPSESTDKIKSLSKVKTEFTANDISDESVGNFVPFKSGEVKKSRTLYTEPSYKQKIKYTKSDGFTGTVETELKSGYQVLKETCEKYGKDFKKYDAFLTKLGDFVDEAQIKYRFVGLDEVNNAKIVYNERTNQIVLSAMVKNGEYPVNFDLTKICKRRIPLSNFINDLAKTKGKNGSKTMLDEVSLTSENLLKINELLRDAGVDTACVGCFVESRRYNINDWANNFINMWNDAVDSNNKNAEYFEFSEGNVNVDDLSKEQISKLNDELEQTRVDQEKEKQKKKEKAESYIKEQKEKGNKIKDDDPLAKKKLTIEEEVSVLVKNTPTMQKKLKIGDIVTENGRTKLHKEFPEIDSLLTRSWGSATPKGVEVFAPYNNEVELLPDMVGQQTLQEYLASIGGARSQSFSDFIMSHIFDVVQKTAGFASRSATAQTYTKVPARAWLFGQTGEKINLSVMFNIDETLDPKYAGLHLVNGKLEYFVGDKATSEQQLKEKGKATYVQSFPFDEAVKLQTTEGYSSDCGIIGVGHGWYHNIMMLDDNRIRYIIGYHSSGMPTEIAIATNIGYSADYTSVQNTLKINGIARVSNADKNYKYLHEIPSYATWSKGTKSTTSIIDPILMKQYKKIMSEGNGKKTMDKLLKFLNDHDLTFTTTTAEKGHGTFPLYEDLAKTKNPKQTADNYINWCLKQGWLPVFYEFSNHDNYYKFIYDFNVYDCITEKYAPQKAIEMKFPSNFFEMADSFMNEYNEEQKDYEAKRKEIRDKGYEAIVKKSKVLDSDGNELSKGQQEYFKDSKARDEEGKLKPFYHGTPHKYGFTIFDSKHSDDKTSLFFTDNLEVASSYSNGSPSPFAENPDRVQEYDILKNAIEDYGYDVNKSNGKVIVENNDGEHYEFNNTRELQTFFIDELAQKDMANDNSGNYSVYLNLTNPLIIDAKNSDWNKLPEYIFNDNAKKYNNFTSISDYEKLIKDLGLDWQIQVDTKYGDQDYYFISNDSGNNFFRTSKNRISRNDDTIFRYFWNASRKENNDKDIFPLNKFFIKVGANDGAGDSLVTTRQYSKYAKENGYDGVIFKNIYDIGGYGMPNEIVPSTVAIAFDSNQVKSTDNLNPTSNLDIRYSKSLDSQGKQLTQEQVDFFANAKIRNEEGLLIPVYHASENKFSTFDISKFGNNYGGKGEFGKGFYFAKTRDSALGWIYGHKGNVIKAYLNITNPFYASKETPKAMWKEVPNFEQYKTQKGDLFISLLQNEGKDSTEILKKYGYDGVVFEPKGFNSNYQTQYVAFEPNQIKSVYNKQPTSGNSIRYSKQLDTEYMDAVNKGDTETAQNIISKIKEQIEIIPNVKNSKSLNLTEEDINNLYSAKVETSETKLRDQAIDNAYASIKSLTEDLKQNVKDGTVENIDYKMLEDAYKEVIRLEKQKAKDDQKLKDMDKSERKEYQDFWKEELNKADAKLDKEIAKLNADQKLKDLHDKYQEQVKNARERRKRSQESQQLLRALMQLKAMRNKTSPDFQAQIDDIIGDINLFGTNVLKKGYTKNDGSVVRGELDLQNLLNELETREQDKNFINDKSYKEYKSWVERFNKKQIGDMSLEEIERLLESATTLRHQILTYNQTVGETQDRLMSFVAHNVANEIESTKARRIGKPTDFSIEVLRPKTFFKQLGGFSNGSLEGMYQELENGQTKFIDFTMKATKPFDDFVERNPEVNKWGGKKADLIEVQLGDKKVKINKMMRISLYMHLQNDDNMKHIVNGGIRVPNMELYNEGKIKEAYARGVVVKATKEVIADLVSNMSPKELEFANLMKKHFKNASVEINNTSMALDGYEKATVDNYYPIHSDPTYLATNFESIVRDFRLENTGSLKAREGGTNPIILEDANNVLLRQIDSIGKYVGYAVPLRNFNTLYNFHIGDGNTIKGLIDRKSTQYGKYIEHLIAQLNGNGGKTSDFSKFSGKYASAVLNFNPSVALSQTASYPTAMAILGEKALRKGLTMGKVDTEVMAKYTPLYWYRTKGYIDNSLSAVKSAPSWIQKLPGTKWIQAMDLLTTRTLWNASQAWVQDNTNLKQGTEDYWQKVAEMYNRTIYDTQPNYTILQRPDVLRSDNELVRQLFMFKTQSYQNFNMLYESLGDMIAKKGTALEGQARKQAFITASTLLIANAVFTAFKNLVKMARNKKEEDWYDEDGDLRILKWLMDNYFPNMLGSIPLGSEVMEAINFNNASYDTFTIPSIDLLNGMISAYQVWEGDIAKAIDSGHPIVYFRQNRAKMMKDIWSLSKKISQFAGIPLENVVKYVGGTLSWFMPEVTTAINNTINPVKKNDIAFSYEFDLLMKNELGFTSDKLYNLYQKAGDMVLPSFDASNSSYELSITEQYDVKEAYQKNVKSIFNTMFNMQDFKSLDSDQQAHCVVNAYSYAKEMALAKVNKEYPKTKWIKEAKSSPSSYIISKNKTYKKK